MTRPFRSSRSGSRPVRAVTLAAPILLMLLWAAGPLSAQPTTPAPAEAHEGHAAPTAGQPAPPAGDAAHGDPHAAEAEGGGHHEESLFSLLSRITNFLLLAGGIFYLARTPLASFLASRAEQIRADLVHAAETRQTAAAELRAIEERMRALPAEIEALEARGRHEVEAEQQRIRAATAAERERLLEQARREVDQQLQAARRALKHEVADLAVGIARLRVTHEITDQDRARLLDRYVAQVKVAHD